MADLLAAGGEAAGTALQGFGQNIQAASGGNFKPLVGQFTPKVATNLMDTFFPENDPTKDPYKPEQPLAYDANNEPVKPAPNKYAGLMDSLGVSPEQQKSQAAEMQQFSKSGFVPMGMQQAPRGVATSVSIAGPLYRQAFGNYL